MVFVVYVFFACVDRFLCGAFILGVPCLWRVLFALWFRLALFVAFPLAAFIDCCFPLFVPALFVSGTIV